MACNCGKGQLHSDIGDDEAVLLASNLRNILSEHHVAEPMTVVCVEDDGWAELREGASFTHYVSKIVLTFHNVSDVQWVTDRLTRNPRP